MQKVIIAVFLVFLLVESIGQNVGQVGDSLINYKDINGNKQGHWQKKYKNDTIAYNAYFKNDKVVGLYKRYYSSGVEKATIKYDNKGNQTGYAKLFWDDGKLMAEGKYVNMNVKDSVWLFYGTDGKLVSEISYKQGIKHGDEVSYFRDGIKSELVAYKDGIKDGLWRRYYESGKTWFETRHVKGKRDGVMNIYHKNGYLKVKGKYINDKKHGTFYYYDSKGNVEEEIIYKRGRAENESELNQKLAKEILEAEQDKGKYQEPSMDDMYKKIPGGGY